MEFIKKKKMIFKNKLNLSFRNFIFLKSIFMSQDRKLCANSRVISFLQRENLFLEIIPWFIIKILDSFSKKFAFHFIPFKSYKNF